VLPYILKRLGLAFLVAVTVSLISFILLYVSGDPATSLAGEGASSEDIAAINALYGFDRPMFVQYGAWLFNAMTGDFGESYYFKMPVATLLADRLSVTMLLGLCGISFALLTAVPLGVLAAMRPNSIIDRVALFLSVAGQAMPSFWFGLILVVIFSIKLRWLPASGAATWAHFVLPTIVLGY
jgi:peptide/nickel transport system permease protein